MCTYITCGLCIKITKTRRRNVSPYQVISAVSGKCDPMTSESELPPFLDCMTVAVASFLSVRRVEHEAQISQVKYGQGTEGAVHQCDPETIRGGPRMLAFVRGTLLRGYAGVENTGQQIPQLVLDVSVEAQAEKNRGKLKVQSVQQGACQVRHDYGSESAELATPRTEYICETLDFTKLFVVKFLFFFCFYFPPIFLRYHSNYPEIVETATLKIIFFACYPYILLFARIIFGLSGNDDLRLPQI